MEIPDNQPKLIMGFDYEALDIQKRSIVEQRTREIRERLQYSAQAIWEIGQKLADVRSQLKHGQFDTWLQAEFDWSRRTAYNFINVYEAFNERANLAQIDIATSALYLLAAPSTSQEIREEFLQRAQEGETITHKKLSQVIKEEKLKSSGAIKKIEQVSIETTANSNPNHLVKQRILAIIPKEKVEEPKSSAKVTLVEPFSVVPSLSPDNIQQGWYLLGGQHILFCGDTASREFIDCIPLSALAIAIASDDWDHDWLVERAKRIIIFPEADFELQKFEQLIEMFSTVGDIVVFPWLPKPEMLAVAHKLKRIIIAGEVNPTLFRVAIAHSGLTIERLVNSPKVPPKITNFSEH
jgi:DNA modification methylase